MPYRLVLYNKVIFAKLKSSYKKLFLFDRRKDFPCKDDKSISLVESLFVKEQI